MHAIPKSDAFKNADAYTIEKRGITSLALMEEASQVCTQWFKQRYPKNNRILVMAGHGNNGGDGLAIARQLLDDGYQINVFRVPAQAYSHDHLANAARLPASVYLSELEIEPRLQDFDLIIDAMLGLGTNRKANGEYDKYISLVNAVANCPVVCIDLPSGMPADTPFYSDWQVVKATTTLCLSAWKLNLLLPPGGKLAGEIVLISFGLDFNLRPQEQSGHWFSPEFMGQTLPYRHTFAHKGEFGHALLIGGSEGMWGAALMAAEACMRAGAGKTTVAAPHDMRTALAIRLPEAMFVRSGQWCWEELLQTEKYTAIGVGPGLGQSPQSWEALKQLITTAQVPLVLDADAINLLAKEPPWLQKLPTNTIITPHVGEFDRLFGPHEHAWGRLETARQWSAKYHINIVLKSAYTFSFVSNLEVPWVNSTGNPGLAKAGTGDVLTGIITSYLAQGIPAEIAAPLGVYVHGLAADLTLQKHPTMSLMASDLFETLGQAAQSAYL